MYERKIDFKKLVLLSWVMAGTLFLSCLVALRKSEPFQLSDNISAAAPVDTLPAEPPPEEVQTDVRTSDDALTVKALIGGEVQELSMKEYLTGVVAAEIPASFPDEALKAQAAAARTYTVYKMRLLELGAANPDEHMGAVVCDDYHHCKAFANVEKRRAMWGEDYERYEAVIENAVTDTDGMIVKYNGEPIAAVFHSASGPRTENAADVWGTETPYLKSVQAPDGSASPNLYLNCGAACRKTLRFPNRMANDRLQILRLASAHIAQVNLVVVAASDFRETVRAAYPEAAVDGAPNTWFRDSRRSGAGGILNVLVGGVRIPGTELREMFGLNSTNFTITPKEDSIVFNTTGYGHGVGLSQYGAKELALQGRSWIEILKTYYTGVAVEHLG